MADPRIFALLTEINIIAQLSRSLMEARLEDGVSMPQFALRALTPDGCAIPCWVSQRLAFWRLGCFGCPMLWFNTPPLSCRARPGKISGDRLWQT